MKYWLVIDDEGKTNYVEYQEDISGFTDDNGTVSFFNIRRGKIASFDNVVSVQEVDDPCLKSINGMGEDVTFEMKWEKQGDINEH